MCYRIGFGYDIHKLIEGDKLIIGGISIAHNKKAQGHSDGDVLIHAICDALLGAANLRDIGFQFPDSSLEYKNIDSKILLKKVNKMLVDKNIKIINIDATVCLEKPKLSPYIEKIKSTISKILNTNVEDISIKATSSEKMGFVGREEGIKCYAVALVKKTK